MEIRLKIELKCNLTPELVVYETTYLLKNENINTRKMLLEIISTENSNDKVLVPDILPKFVTVQKQQVNVKFIKDFDGMY